MTAKLNISLRDDACVILLDSEITEDVAIALQRALERCFTYYHYGAITLSINSPGGSVHALRHIVACLFYWRNRRRKIDTLGNFRVGSAAALLLTCGEVGQRAVYPHSSLLFHQARIGYESAMITAGAASTMAKVLRNYDEGMLTMVADHVAHGFGGVGLMHAECLARCALLRREHSTIAMSLGETASAKIPAWLKPLEALYSTGLKSKSLTGYVRYLAKRFELDTPMDLREAWVLGLFDRIVGVEALRSTMPQRRPPELHNEVNPSVQEHKKLAFNHDLI